MITKRILLAATVMAVLAPLAYAGGDSKVEKGATAVPASEAVRVARSFPEGSFSKMAIERPLKKAISDLSAPVGGAISELRTSTLSPAAVSPHGKQVQPGLVNWESNFKTACLKAKTSAKPVLHFQMMGRLDEEFC